MNQPLKQLLTGKKKEEDENTKSWLSRERKDPFKLNKKTFFIVFDGLSFGEKIKIW